MECVFGIVFWLITWKSIYSLAFLGSSIVDTKFQTANSFSACCIDSLRLPFGWKAHPKAIEDRHRLSKSVYLS